MEKVAKELGAPKLTDRVSQVEGTPITIGIGHAIDLGCIGTKAEFIGFYLAREA